MIFLILFAIASANAGSLETCTVGTWSDWSECTPSRHCSEEKQVVYSWPMPESAEWDSGREKMEIMMKKKQEIWQQREECRAAGTCPELFARPSSGSFDCVDGLAGDVPCLNVDQLSFVNFVDLGYGTPVTGDRTPAGNDVWGWTDPLNGDEYAIIGLTGGTSFVRVTDPANPVTVGFIYTATLASTWRDIKVIGNYAYIVSEARNHGLQVFDLTRLRGRTQVVYDQPDSVNNDFGNAHNIAENSDTNFVYVVGATSTTGYPKVCKGGLLVIDVSNPLNPTFAGCFGDDGYVHDTQCVIYHGPDTRYTGREICFCFNEDSFTLVDVTDKSNMRMIAKSGYINVAYTHQGWVTEDHALVLLDDELDEYRQSSIAQYTKTYAWDVTDLQNPTLSTVFESSEKSIDHNQYIIGDLTYQANYESGLRILHIDRSTDTLSQVGYFDVLPSSTAAEFNGAWSVYPYFKSGTVVISSIDYGLFVVRPNISAIRNQIETNYAEQTRTRSVVHSVPYASCPPLVETRTCKSTIVC